MTGQIIKKVVQKLKRPKEEWYFDATETFERFHFLLGLAPAYNFSQCDNFELLLFGQKLGEFGIWLGRDSKWEAFQDEIELRFGRIDYDSSSTLATTDDNPGTGRLIDKFVYQPIGQSIERLFLALEIRYFHSPEKNACQIRRFLDRSEYFGDLVSVDEIFDHELFYEVHYLNEVDFKEECVSLFLEISRKEKVAKAFQRLLMQASSKKRSLRVEAQKQIWSLLRYKNMVFVLNAFTDLENLMWDGYTTTFQHCSPLDPDFQTHFLFVMKMHLHPDVLVDICSSFPFGMLCISMRDILETCARENRGFSSLPINLVIQLLSLETYDSEILDHEEKFAENLYLALIAITGFCNEFSYASDFLTEEVKTRCFCYINVCERMSPLWKKDRTESDIIALELMPQLMILSSLIISIPGSISEASATNGLEYCTALLSDADKGQGTMSKLEVKASEDYLRKVTEALVQRGPISFAMFKDIVTNPLIWEKYHGPERGTEAKGKSRASTTWQYDLCIDIDYSLKPPILSCRAIPFSDNFGDQHIDGLFQYIKWEIEEEDFAGPVDAWFRIQKCVEEFEDNIMGLPYDRLDTGLACRRVMKWWRSYNIHEEMSRIFEGACRSRYYAQRLLRRSGEPTTLPSPCQCGICKRSSHIPEKDKDGTLQTNVEDHSLPLRTEDVSSQNRRQPNPATESSSLPSRSGPLKEEEPRPQIAPLPRRYRDNTAEDAETVNMIYATTLQSDQATATATSAIGPRPLDRETEASLIIRMSGLHIQKRKRGRPQRPSLVRDLLNPTIESQFENSPYELWTSTCEVNSISAASREKGAKGFDGRGIGRQAVQMLLADSDVEFLRSDIIQSYPSYQRRSSPKSEGSRTLYFGTKGESARPDSPCLCRIWERSRCIARKEGIVATRTQPSLTSLTVSPPRFEAGPAQTEVERVPAVSCSPFWKEAGVDDLLLQEERSSPQPEVEDSQVHKSSPHLGQKRTFGEETAQYGSNLLGKKRKTSHTRNTAVHFPGSETSTANELATLPDLLKRADDLSRRRFEGGHIRKISLEEDAETVSFQPTRKKQKFLHNFEDTSSSSDTDSTTTETNESKSEGDVSEDEEFRFAKTRLSLLSIQ